MMLARCARLAPAASASTYALPLRLIIGFGLLARFIAVTGGAARRLIKGLSPRAIAIEGNGAQQNMSKGSTR
jgi:hypothetical protein